MTLQTTKVRNGALILPSKLRKSWQGAEVLVEVYGDTISVKRLTKPALSLKEMLAEISQAVGKTKLSKKEVEKTIQEVRRKLYK